MQSRQVCLCMRCAGRRRRHVNVCWLNFRRTYRSETHCNWARRNGFLTNRVPPLQSSRPVALCVIRRPGAIKPREWQVVSFYGLSPCTLLRTHRARRRAQARALLYSPAAAVVEEVAAGWSKMVTNARARCCGGGTVQGLQRTCQGEGLQRMCQGSLRTRPVLCTRQTRTLSRSCKKHAWEFFRQN